jgi:hypothetical protein
MDQSSTPEILAHWQIPAEVWQNFVSDELRTQLKTLRAYRKWFFVVIAVSLLIMAVFVIVPYLIYGAWEWGEDVYGPVFGVALIAGIFLFIIGIFWLMQRNKIALLKTPTGDVRIMLDGVRVNGFWFNWVYEQGGWQLKKVSRRIIDKGGGINSEILEFDFFSRDPGGDIEYQEKTERVPVPPGKSAEADAVVRRLEAEINRFA